MKPETMQSSKRAAAVAFAAACVFSAGRCSAGDRGTPPRHAEREPTPARTVTVEKIKTVIETVTVAKNLTPKSCIEALRDLENISKTASDFAEMGVKQLQVAVSAREAIIGRDYSQLTGIEEDQMKINDDTVGYVKDLSVDWMPHMKKSASDCRKSAK